MRIFYSSDGSDPMLLDQEEVLHLFASELQQVASGARLRGVFPAETNGRPEPYAEFLRGIRVRRVDLENSEMYLADDRWLDLRISGEELERLCRNVQQLKNGDHTHLYASSISLIIEANDSWPGLNEG